VRRFALISGLMFLGFATAIAAGVFVQVRIGLAPVLRMGASVAEVREGRSERVEGRFPVELQGLADELNSLLDHSRDIVERSRTHVGNLAHALKTPIAVLTNESRGRDDELAQLVARQTEAMSQQVDHHLRRARAAAHAKAVGARTEIAPLVVDLARTLRRIYAHEGVTIETELDPDLVFRGERQDLEDMLGNLIDNACKYSNGFVQITMLRDGVEDGPGEGRRALILIEDDGPGLDEAACAAATERGVRLDEQAPGSGLGLAIVADLARAYEGGLTLDRAEMGGLRARLDLPAAAPR
jgi:signal transduction histidine kinase